MTDTPMTPDRDPSRREELLFMLLHGGARYEAVAQRVVDLAASEVRDEYAPEVARLGDALQGVMDEIAQFGIYSPARTAAAALVRRADELVTENATLRARVAELEALKPARFQDCQVCGAGYEYGKPCSACEFNKQMAAATGEARQARDLRPGATAARRMLRRPGACFTCGDVPDEWCPDCACCKAGCDGGRTNNPCTHPNAPWNTEASR
ncbi:hypothetical protein [Streptomyces badius]